MNEPANPRLQRTRSARLLWPVSLKPLGGSPWVVRLVALHLALVGCGLVPEEVSLADTRVAPMLKAMKAVDRQPLGFSPVEADARISLEWSSRHAYDAMLHIYGSTSRTVSFRRTTDGYRWIAEQETHYGPRISKLEDGDVREFIVVEYQTEPINGLPVNQVHVSYMGDGPALRRPLHSRGP